MQIFFFFCLSPKAFSLIPWIQTGSICVCIKIKLKHLEKSYCWISAWKAGLNCSKISASFVFICHCNFENLLVASRITIDLSHQRFPTKVIKSMFQVFKLAFQACGEKYVVFMNEMFYIILGVSLRGKNHVLNSC